MGSSEEISFLFSPPLRPSWKEKRWQRDWDSLFFCVLLKAVVPCGTGGITRNVIVHELPASLYMKQIETTVQGLRPGSIDARVVFAGVTQQASSHKVMLSHSFDHGPASKAVEFSMVDGVVELRGLLVPNATLWTLEQPNLHTLTISLGAAVDSPQDQIVVRFGLRLLGTENGRITLNGQRVKLVGYNRHTMYPDTGSALTLQQVSCSGELRWSCIRKRGERRVLSGIC